MKRAVLAFIVLLTVAGMAQAATEQEKQLAIDKGLAWLASTQATSGTEGYWWYDYEGTLAATGSAALAFIEEGYLPGADVIIDTGSGPVNYGDVVGKATNYIFNRARSTDIGMQLHGHPENYDNSVDNSGDGNGQGIYFDPANFKRDVYTTGIITPVVYALGEALGEDTAVGRGTVSTMTYKEVMRDVVDWFSYGQDDDGTGRGGWRYTDNYGDSDNSTAQWGALPMLYANSWSLPVPAFVKSELELWTDSIQNPVDAGVDWRDGGSGYMNPNQYVNIGKTGGLLLQFAVEGKSLSHPDVQDALYYMRSMEGFDHWNQGPVWEQWESGQWDGGNFNNAYAMWAVYKGLATYGGLVWNDNGTPGDTSDDFIVGNTGLVPTAQGGFTIGQDWNEITSAAGDWYSQYCDYLVGIQNANGSWNGWEYWTGSLATGWYINILNATGAPEPYVPVPAAVLLGGLGLSVAGWKLRRQKEI